MEQVNFKDISEFDLKETVDGTEEIQVSSTEKINLKDQLDKVIPENQETIEQIIYDNTLSALDENSNKPVSSGAVAKELAERDTAIAGLQSSVAGKVDNADFRKESIRLQSQIDNVKPIEIVGDVTNAPDEEDITTDANNLLKLKDRPFGKGKGYKILRSDKTFAEQVADPDTIYEVRYDFDLGGETVELLEGAALKFVGGSISNANVILNNTSIETKNPIFGDNVSISGKALQEASPEWFTGSDADKIERAISLFGCVKLAARDYIIDREIVVKSSFMLTGVGIPDFFGDRVNNKGDLSSSRLLASFTSGSIIKVVGAEYSEGSTTTCGSYIIKNVSFKGNEQVDGITFTSYGAPARPVVISQCNFTSCNKGIAFDTTSMDALTTGTGCCNISIRENCIAKNNYGIFGDGRYVIGQSTIADNVIEQNKVCGIWFNSSSNYGVVMQTHLFIQNNMMEGQPEAFNIKGNGSYIHILGNYFENPNGQTGNIEMTNKGYVIIEGATCSSGEVKVSISGAMVNCQKNNRDSIRTKNIKLILRKCHIVNCDILIEKMNWYVTADSAFRYLLEAEPLAYQISADPMNAYHNNQFVRKIDNDGVNKYQRLGTLTLDKGEYLMAVKVLAPREATNIYVSTGGLGIEFWLPIPTFRNREEYILYIPFTYTEETSQLIQVLLKNTGPVPIYVTGLTLYESDGYLPSPKQSLNSINKPTLLPANKGASYFDNTLGKAIWWDGTKWVDATGTAV